MKLRLRHACAKIWGNLLANSRAKLQRRLIQSIFLWKVTNRHHGFCEMRKFGSATIIRDSDIRYCHSSCVKCVAQGVQDVTAPAPHFVCRPDCETSPGFCNHAAADQKLSQRCRCLKTASCIPPIMTLVKREPSKTSEMVQMLTRCDAINTRSPR